MFYNVHVDHVSLGQYDTLSEAQELVMELATKDLDAEITLVASSAGEVLHGKPYIE